MDENEIPVRIPIEDVFDLHTVPPRDVKAVLEAYLEEAHRLGGELSLDGRMVRISDAARRLVERSPDASPQRQNENAASKPRPEDGEHFSQRHCRVVGRKRTQYCEP